MQTAHLIIVAALGLAALAATPAAAQQCPNDAAAQGIGDMSNASGRRTTTEWKPVVLEEMRTVTGVTLAPEQAQRREARHLRKQLRLKTGDTSQAILVAFRYSLEDDKYGKAQRKLDAAFDDEKVSRWARLMHCVEVDVESSAPSLVARFGGGDAPSIVILDAELNVVATGKPFKSAKKAAQFLQSSLRKKLPGYWESIEADLDAQEDQYDEAQRLLKAGDADKACEILEKMYWSPLRIGDHWEKAAALLQRATEQRDRQERRQMRRR